MLWFVGPCHVLLRLGTKSEPFGDIPVNATKEPIMKPVFSMLVTALTLTAVTPASADQVCMPYYEMRAALIDWYGERHKGPVTNVNEQLWVSDVSGTWTLVKTLSDGNACVLAQGDDWMGGLDTDQIVAALE